MKKWNVWMRANKEDCKKALWITYIYCGSGLLKMNETTHYSLLINVLKIETNEMVSALKWALNKANITFRANGNMIIVLLAIHAIGRSFACNPLSNSINNFQLRVFFLSKININQILFRPIALFHFNSIHRLGQDILYNIIFYIMFSFGYANFHLAASTAVYISLSTLVI